MTFWQKFSSAMTRRRLMTGAVSFHLAGSAIALGGILIIVVFIALELANAFTYGLAVRNSLLHSSELRASLALARLTSANLPADRKAEGDQALATIETELKQSDALLQMETGIREDANKLAWSTALPLAGVLLFFAALFFTQGLAMAVFEVLVEEKNPWGVGISAIVGVGLVFWAWLVAG